jgi:hypothetical protein
MKPDRAAAYYLLACHFLAGAVRARRLGGEGLLKRSRDRAQLAKACFLDWRYHLSQSLRAAA